MKRTPSTIAAGILALAGLALLACAGAVWIRAGRTVDTWTAKRATHESEIKETRAQLVTVNLRYQAFQKSLPAVPDSIRKSSGGMLREEQRMHEKSIKKLKNAEQDLELDLIRDKRKQTEAAAERKRRMLPFAVAGASAWLGTALLAMVSRGRRNAA